MPEEPTLGEVFRRLDRVESRIDTRVVSLNTYQAERIADRELVATQRLADQQQVANLRIDLEKLSASVTWAWRTVAATALGIITFVITQLLSGGVP